MMNKCISVALKLVILACFAIFLTKYVLYKQAVIKQKTDSIFVQETPNMTKEESQVLSRLSDLADLPLIGSYFAHPLAQELIRLSRYSQSVELIEKYLSSDFKRKDYNLWLSKAKAQLFLEQLQNCEQSLLMASLYTKNRKEERKIAALYEELNNWKASKKVLKAEQKKPLEAKQVYYDNKDYVKYLQQKQNEIL